MGTVMVDGNGLFELASGFVETALICGSRLSCGKSSTSLSSECGSKLFTDASDLMVDRGSNLALRAGLSPLSEELERLERFKLREDPLLRRVSME